MIPQRCLAIFDLYVSKHAWIAIEEFLVLLNDKGEISVFCFLTID